MKQSILILTFILTLSVMAQPANTNLSATQTFEGEPYLAVNPANTANIVVAWMAFDLTTHFRTSIRTKVSFDGGATWGHDFVQPHFSPTFGSADVSMAFRPNGKLYLSYVDYSQAADSGGVYITHSGDGGVTWSTPVRVWNANTEDPTKLPLDRPWLVVDNSGTASDGTLYMTTKPAPWIPAPCRPYLKVSKDSGQTWSSYRYIDSTGYLVGSVISAPMAAPAVSANGTFYAAYPSYMTTQSLYSKIVLARSVNRGAGISYNDLLVNPPSVGNSNYKLGYKLATDPTNANRVAFAAIGAPYGDPDIMITTSNDGGNTWHSQVRVNDDSIGNGKAQDMVWMSYAANGDLVAIWRDRRNGIDTGFAQPSDTYCALSKDNGVTFKPNVRLSDMTAPFDTILSHSGNDFMGCALVADTIYGAWSDIRNGHLNIYFAKASVNTGTGTGVKVIDEEQCSLALYPNPANGLVNVQFSGEEKQISLSFYDATGQRVLLRKITTGKSSQPIDVSSLSAGTYFVSASANGKIIAAENLSIVR